MRRVRRGLPRLERHGAAAAAVVAVVLGGCGGGGDDSGSASTPTPSEDITRTIETIPASPSEGAAISDEKLIRASTTTVFASGDPTAACETYATSAYVTDAFGDLDGCKAAVTSGGHAKAVTIAHVVVDGDRATALAVPIGGPSADQVIDVGLVKDGDVWKVDSGKANVPVGP